jgi:lipoprotein NlpD
MMNRLVIVVLVACIAGCAARRPAPVVERSPEAAPPAVVEAPSAAPEPAPAPPEEKALPTHTVKRGETLVSIALQYGLDYRELAAWNNILNPAAVKVGQVLVIAAPPGSAPAAPSGVATPLVTAGPPIEARPLGNTASAKVEPRGQKVPFSERALAQMDAEAGVPAPAPASGPETAPVPEPPKRAGTDIEDIDWMWPVKGKVLAPFTEASKGMDIAGRKGQPVLAAANGRVIYADAGLRGYGKLVIIRHNDTWLSAYAHNDNILVKEQQEVRKGQKIAEMGASDTDQVKLHFEVRRQGKPVDPAKFLPGM